MNHLDVATDKVLRFLQRVGDRHVSVHEVEGIVKEALGKDKTTEFVREVTREVIKKLERPAPGRGALKNYLSYVVYEDDDD